MTSISTCSCYGQGRLTAVKRILFVSPRIVGNFYARAPLVRILKQVHIGALVEPVMARVVCRRAIKVVDVSVASDVLDQPILFTVPKNRSQDSQSSDVLLSRPGGHLRGTLHAGEGEAIGGLGGVEVPRTLSGRSLSLIDTIK